MGPEPRSRIVARALKCAGKIYAQSFHHLDVLSPCPLRRRGPAILVCNHTSGLDPVLIQAACPRLVTWMMAREYYDIAALRWGFEAIEAIPVERSGNDVAATRAALRALHAGRVIGIFPEGRIEPTRELLPFQTGVAMLAHRGKAPVYPAYIDGSQRGKDMLAVYLQPQSAKLTFGATIELNVFTRKIDLDAVTAAIQGSVERLRSAASSLLPERRQGYETCGSTPSRTNIR
jgi:1-acyl-sn-glycerol-3-phosphate acyltransferase